MFRMLALALSLALCADSAAAFQSPASSSLLGASRVAQSTAVQPCRFSSLIMCDAPADEAAPAAAEAEAAPAAAEAEAPPAQAPRAAKTPLEELEVGAEVEGKIRSVMAYGAFVDIGAATDALLHVSEISNEFVKDATEKLTAGDTVKGRIKAINLEKQQLALSCKDPSAARARGPRVKVDLTKYESADVKEFVTGKVNSITDFGAFVTLEEGVDGLVHISQVQEGGVGKVSDVLTIGQEVQVRIQQVDKSKRRIGLSMLPWSEESEKKGRRGGGGGGNWDVGFGESDKEFHMNAEELEALAVGEFTSSPFEAAFARATDVMEKKKKKEKYSAQIL